MVSWLTCCQVANMVATVSMVTVRSVANPSIITVLIVYSGCSRCQHRQENPVNWWQNHGWKWNARPDKFTQTLCLSFKSNQQFPGAESCSDFGAASIYSLPILLSSLHPSVFFTLPSTRTRNVHEKVLISLSLTHSGSRTLAAAD